MKKTILLFFCFLAYAAAVFSQGSEAGVMLGGSYYKGDIHPDFFRFNTIQPAIGVMYRYNFHPHYSFKGNVYYGTISATDADMSDGFQLNRNLSFRSEILEFSGQLEFNFLPYRIENKNQSFTPYLFTGVSLFKFNPQGQYANGEWYDLQPLGTEGQGTTGYPDKKKYSLTGFGIPLGGGLKWNLGLIGITLEAGARRTFTDYLDDVSGTYADPTVLSAEYGPVSAWFSDRSLSSGAESNAGRQRGDSKNNDWYIFGGAMITVNLSSTNVFCEPFKKKYGGH
jgi:hypothetical protein